MYAGHAFDDDAPKDPLAAAIESHDRDVLHMVRNALAADNAQLAFQPVMSAQNLKHVAFYEGLVRLKDQAGRIIPAKHFMGSIEETDLGRDIDCASLRLGIAKLAENPELRLSINMSARSIADGKWRDVLNRGLWRNPDLAARLILEISESSAMTLHEVVVRFMAEMQPLGVCFALDDFGGGMIAFRHLKDFFFDMVKLDRCFIRGIDEVPDNQVIAEALITVARQFEMFAVAEGVETVEEANLMRGLGVDCLQGYLFGVPKFNL
jgi:EAL domain-containing protein (putative c-di-GMP-specific phosphodiesterase class I)